MSGASSFLNAPFSSPHGPRIFRQPELTLRRGKAWSVGEASVDRRRRSIFASPSPGWQSNRRRGAPLPHGARQAPCAVGSVHRETSAVPCPQAGSDHDNCPFINRCGRILGGSAKGLLVIAATNRSGTTASGGKSSRSLVPTNTMVGSLVAPRACGDFTTRSPLGIVTVPRNVFVPENATTPFHAWSRTMLAFALPAVCGRPAHVAAIRGTLERLSIKSSGCIGFSIDKIEVDSRGAWCYKTPRFR